MVVDRERSPTRLPRLVVLVLASVLAVVGPAAGPPWRRRAGRSGCRMPASGGRSTSGPAAASVCRVFDPAAGGYVLKLDYTIPQGSAAGVWTKGFPPGLNAGSIDVVRLAAREADPEGSRQIAVALEIKGTAGIQSIPLEIHPDWTFVERTVDWAAIGAMKEVVVSVSRRGDGATAVGTLDLDVRFERLPGSGSSACSRSPGSAASWRPACSRCSMGVLRLLSLRRPGPEPSGEAFELPAREHPATARWVAGLGRDFVLGVGAVAIVCLAIGIYRARRGGTAGGRLDARLGWRRGGGHRGVVEVRADRQAPDGRGGLPGHVATGLLAASSSPLAILQAPATWSELLLLSQPVAAVAAFALPRGQRASAGDVGPAPGRGRRRDDRRDALRGRRAAPARIAAAWCRRWGASSRPGRWRPARRGRVRGAGGRPLRLQRGRGQRARPGDEADAAPVGPGPTWRCSPSRSPRSRPRGSRRSGRARRSPSWPRRAPAGRRRGDDRALAGGALGRGLPDHRHGPGRASTAARRPRDRPPGIPSWA